MTGRVVVDEGGRDERKMKRTWGNQDLYTRQKLSVIDFLD